MTTETALFWVVIVSLVLSTIRVIVAERAARAVVVDALDRMEREHLDVRRSFLDLSKLARASSLDELAKHKAANEPLVFTRPRDDETEADIESDLNEQSAIDGAFGPEIGQPVGGNLRRRRFDGEAIDEEDDET